MSHQEKIFSNGDSNPDDGWKGAITATSKEGSDKPNGFKWGTVSLQWGMGDCRYRDHHGCTCKRDSNAGVLWEEGGLDAGEMWIEWINK